MRPGPVRFLQFLKTAALAILLTVSLAGCKSAEERAEEHYQRGLELLEAGDPDRAIVELRNVFELNGSHRAARHTLAELMLEHQDNPQGAYGQYLRLVEQYPDDLKARIALSEIAVLSGNWDEVERHGTKAAELEPDNPRVAAIALALDYRTVALAQDASGMRALAERAKGLLEGQPDSLLLRNMLVDVALREQDFGAAMEQLDWLLERDPDNGLYMRQRLAILAQQGDKSAVEAQLLAMIESFPEDRTHKQTLIQFYLADRELDKAETFLRKLAAGAPEGQPGPRLDLIRFLSELRSPEAALAETRKAIAEAADPVPFQVVAAGLDFEAGRREAGIAALEGILKTAAEASDQTRNIKIALSRMLISTGNEVGARALVEEVLAEQPAHVQALKMQAGWLIDADDTDKAISGLRIALEEAPEDAQAMTLMAQAYTRAGRPELAREFLALAVDASQNAPVETLRYARLLIGEERYLPAEDLLVKALRKSPGNPDLLVEMGRLYLAMDDPARAEQVARSLREIGTDATTQAANALDAERINRRNGPEQAMAYLEELAEGADASLTSKIALVRVKLDTGETEAALKLARELAASDPDVPLMQVMLAAAEAASGNLDTAEGLYRGLLEKSPAQPGIWMLLSRIAAAQGGLDAADAVIDEALAAVPEDPQLLWARASALERKGDIDGAIAIYEALYARDSSAVVVANNLASLISTYKDDAASLERAWIVARRFSEAEVPALQDTYGWILHRRGDSAGALPYLEAAARGLAEEALVQYHLAQAYLAVGEKEKALAQFRRAADLAGPADTRPQIETARAKIAELEAEN